MNVSFRWLFFFVFAAGAFFLSFLTVSGARPSRKVRNVSGAMACGLLASAGMRRCARTRDSKPVRTSVWIFARAIVGQSGESAAWR